MLKNELELQVIISDFMRKENLLIRKETNHVLYCEYTSTGENLPFLEEEYGVATENGGFQMNGRWSDNPMVL